MDGLPRNRRRSADAGLDAPRATWTGPERRERAHFLSPAFRPASAPTPTPSPVSVAVQRSPALGANNARAMLATPPRATPAEPPPRARLRWLVLALGALVSAALVLSSRLEGQAAEPSQAAVAPDAVDRTPRDGVPAASATAALSEPHEPPVEPTTLEIGGAELRAEDGLARADARINTKGYAHLPGGVLYAPKTFSSEDGAYDLLLHFHGNTGVVVESAEHARLNAIVAIINLGTGSGPYEAAYASPGLYEALLDRINVAVAERGLTNAHLRRVALSSWSAGYGALSSILEWRTGRDRLDALVVLDGIHCGFVDATSKRIKSQNLAPFVTAARDAADGKLLFSITHSDVEPLAYASSSATASFLLDAVGGHRNPSLDLPEHVELRAAVGAVSKKLEKRMEPETDGRVGGFHVRGYRGNTAEHHMAHLLQMASTALPELHERWSSGD